MNCIRVVNCLWNLGQGPTAHYQTRSFSYAGKRPRLHHYLTSTALPRKPAVSLSFWADFSPAFLGKSHRYNRYTINTHTHFLRNGASRHRAGSHSKQSASEERN